MKSAAISFFALSALTLGGCASLTPKDIVSKPSNIGVESALSQLGQGFGRMKQNLGDTQLGLYPCKITVNLNVTASADKSGKLVLDLDATPPVELISASAGVDAEVKAEAQAERGNSMIIEMYNPLCLPPGTLAYEKPDKYPLIIQNIPEEAPLTLPPLDG